MPRIMLVDDEQCHQRPQAHAVARLAGRGLQIETFDDPRVALERAGEVDFSLVISDFRMPPMDGVGFLKRFRVIQPDAVRLILSASSDVEAPLAAINEAGIFRLILKPWDDVDLCCIVREALLHFDEQSAERQLVDRRVPGGGAVAGGRAAAAAQGEPGITQVKWGPGGTVLLDDE